MSHREHSGRTDQAKAALKRKSDAHALLDPGDGAHGRRAAYLAGYAIECKLRAIAMEAAGVWTLDQLAEKWKVDERQVYEHGLEVFAKRFGLYDKLCKSHVGRDFAGQVNQWRPS